MGLSSCRRTQRCLYSLSRNQDPALLFLDCSIFPVYCLNLPFELKEDLGVWSFFLQARNGPGCVWGGGGAEWRGRVRKFCIQKSTIDSALLVLTVKSNRKERKICLLSRSLKVTTENCMFILPNFTLYIFRNKYLCIYFYKTWSSVV